MKPDRTTESKPDSMASAIPSDTRHGGTPGLHMARQRHGVCHERAVRSRPAACVCPRRRKTGNGAVKAWLVNTADSRTRPARARSVGDGTIAKTETWTRTSRQSGTSTWRTTNDGRRPRGRPRRVRELRRRHTFQARRGVPAMLVREDGMTIRPATHGKMAKMTACPFCGEEFAHQCGISRVKHLGECEEADAAREIRQ